jgi:hypothetical protein
METGNRARRFTPAYGRYRQFPAGDGATAPRVGGDLGGGGARPATSVAQTATAGPSAGGSARGRGGDGAVCGALCGALGCAAFFLLAAMTRLLFRVSQSRFIRVIAECFPAVWTTITPGDGEGERTVRLSRLPGRLTPVTWRDEDPEQEGLRLTSWPELRFFRRRPSDSAVTERQGRAFRMRTSWRPVTVRRARPTCQATAPGGLASPVRARRRGARSRPR